MLTSTVGLGAICGGAWLLLRPGIAGLTGVVLANTLLISLAILAFTATDRFYVALPCVFIAGCAMTITGIGAQTLIQAAVEIGMRGRIMALYGMIFRAGPALGAVLMGSLSERFGLRLPLAVGAVVSCGFWAATWLKQQRIAATFESRTDDGRNSASEFVRSRCRRRVRLFCFGLGYSALALARELDLRRMAGDRHLPQRRDGCCSARAGYRVDRFDRDRPLAGDGAGRGHPCAGVGPARRDRRPGARPPRRRHRGAARACPGSAICRPPASTATAAAAGSTRARALQPSGERGRRRVAAEAGWLDLWRRRGVPVHIFRLAGIYGPGRNPFDGVARRHRAAHRQARPGLLAHPCRGSGARAVRLDVAAAARRDLQCLRRRARRARGGGRPCRRAARRAARRRLCRSPRPGCRRWRGASTTTTSGSGMR